MTAEAHETVVPLLVTFADAARMLATGQRTVRRMLASGYLERVELPGRRPRITRASVLRLVARAIKPAGEQRRSARPERQPGDQARADSLEDASRVEARTESGAP